MNNIKRHNQFFLIFDIEQCWVLSESMFRKVFILTFCVALIAAIPDEEEFEKCGQDFKCAEDKLITLIDEYDAEPSLPIVGNAVTVERTNFIKPAANEGLYERFSRYMASHEVQFSFPQSSRAGKTIIAGMPTRKENYFLINM